MRRFVSGAVAILLMAPGGTRPCRKTANHQQPLARPGVVIDGDNGEWPGPLWPSKRITQS